MHPRLRSLKGMRSLIAELHRKEVGSRFELESSAYKTPVLPDWIIPPNIEPGVGLEPTTSDLRNPISTKLNYPGWSARKDSNPRLQSSQPCALSRLSYEAFLLLTNMIAKGPTGGIRLAVSRARSPSLPRLILKRDVSEGAVAPRGYASSGIALLFASSHRSEASPRA